MNAIVDLIPRVTRLSSLLDKKMIKGTGSRQRSLAARDSSVVSFVSGPLNFSFPALDLAIVLF
jgi:hypothetical protein